MIKISNPNIDNAEIETVEKVLSERSLCGGSYTEVFESDFKKYIGVPHACCTSSGTTALMSIMKSLELPSKTKVITTCFSFIATTNAILYADYT